MYDALFKISPNRSLTRERFLLCENAVIASAGARTYDAAEVEGVEPDSRGKVTLLRDKQVLFSPETLASFEGKPVTLEHPKEKVVDLDNWKSVAVGNVMNVRAGTGTHESDLLADVLIFDKDTIEKVLSGEYEALSAGFTSAVKDVGGGCGRESSFIGNHVSIVPRGRDASCVLCDSLPSQGEHMDDKKKEAAAEAAPDLKKQDSDVTAAEPSATAETQPQEDLTAVVAALTERVTAQDKRLAALEALVNKEAAEEPQTVTDAEEPKDETEPEAAAPVAQPQAEAEKPKEDAEAAEEKPQAEAPNFSELAALVAAEVIKQLKAGTAVQPQNDACVKNDAADVAPNIASDTPNLAVAALTEFAKTAEGAAFIGSMGGIKNDSAPSLLKACASFKRAQNAQAVQSVKNDSAAKPMTFEEMARRLWR